MNKNELLELIEQIIEKEKSESCTGCAYWDREEWEEPCKRCKRACKDYWRIKEGDRKHD